MSYPKPILLELIFMPTLLSSVAFSFSKDIYKENQDSILPPKRINDGYIFAIADGVGSYEGARLASSVAVSNLEKISSNVDSYDIDSIFQSIRQQVIEIGVTNSNYKKASTTLTFCFISKTGLYIGHIGDCRLYYKVDTKLIKLTNDHTQHQKLLDDKLYTKKELEKIPGKNTLTTAIYKYVDMKYDNIFIPFCDLPISNDKLCLYIMSDGAYHYWDKRPRFSSNTMNNITKFSSSLQRRIERNEPIDDYSLVAVELEFNPTNFKNT